MIARRFGRPLGLFALVVVALLVLTVLAVELISWNFLKPRIAAQVESATGRELSIGGNVEVDLLPRPRITLHDVSLANPDWAAAAHFLEFDRLRVAPDLLALAGGRLALARIDLDAPVVRLIERSDGPANWVMAGDDDAGGEAVPVHRIMVTNAEIRYRPAENGQSLTFRIPALELRDDGRSSRAEATLAIRDRKIEIEAETDSVFSWPSPDPSFGGELRLSTAESHIDSEFSFSKSAFLSEWQVRVEAEIADIDRWIDLLPGPISTNIGALALDASLARSGSTWQAEAVDISAVAGRLQADLEVDTADEVPELSGSIRSSSINVAALRKALPASDSSAPQTDALAPPPILPRLAGSLEVDIGEIAGLMMPVTAAEARLRFEPHGLAVENINVTAADGTLRGSARISSTPEAVSAAVAISAEGIRSDAGEDSGKTFDGDFDLRLDAVSRKGWSTEAIVRHLAVETARLDFAYPQTNTRLSATAELSPEKARPVVTVSGTLKGRPLEAGVEGGALAAAWPGPAYAVECEAASGSLTLSVETTLRSVLDLEHFNGRLSLAGDSVADLAPFLGLELMPTPPFRLSGALDRDGGQWKTDELRVEIGESIVRGGVEVDVEGRPRLAATLETASLDLAWLQARPGGRSADQAPGGGSPDLTWLRSFDAELDVDAAEVTFADGPDLNELELHASVAEGAVDLQRLAMHVAGGAFALEGQLDAADVPASAEIDARFDDIALAQLDDTFTALEERLGLLSGNLQIAATQTLAEAFRDDIVAPMIGRVKIEPSQLRFTDTEAGTDLSLDLETGGLADGEQRFRVDGSGRYDGDPFSMTYRSDALLDIRLPGRPYAVDLDASIVESRIELDGALQRPLALEGLDLQLALAGPNPQQLSRLLGLPLPDLPAYDVSGQLGLQQGRWSLRELDGTVGKSDLRGRISLETDTMPPTLTGELRSDSLDIDDLAGIAGAESAAGKGETASKEQRRQTGDARDDRYVLPAEPFIGDAWRQVRADVRYRASAVRAGDVPLSDLVIDFRLTDGVARFEPVGFGVGQGSVDFTLEMNASRQPTEGTLAMEVRGVDLREALQDWDLADESVGIVAAQGKFWIKGESIADLLGSADGGLLLLMTEGRLEALLVELAGLDASQAFLSWLRGRPAIPINCAYADLKARDGRVRLDTFVVDTTDTIFTAGGEVDFDDERLDISVLAHPQDASALIARTPFHFGGTFADIQTGVHGGEAALRIGASAGLAALAGPLAAVVPLLEAGVDDRTGYCQGLVQRTRDAIETDDGYEDDDDDEAGS